MKITYNEKIKDKYNKGGEYDYGHPAFLKVGISAMSSFDYYNVPGNCKVCVLCNMQNPVINHTAKTVERINELFTRNVMALAFMTTFTSKGAVTTLSKHFRLISEKKIPIGYGDGYQYHCTFLVGNPGYSNYEHYIQRIDKMEAAKKKKKEAVARIKLIANKEDIIRVTKADLLKIRDYKREGYANRYINKLVNGENL